MTQFDIPLEILASVRDPDNVHTTYDGTPHRYWQTPLGWLHLTPYKGSDAVLFFACSAQCVGSCCGHGARTLAQIRELFSYPPWRERHGLEPASRPVAADRLWESIKEISRGG